MRIPEHKDVVFVNRPNSYKEDCGWKCKDSWEADHLAKFMKENGVPHEILVISEGAWNDLPEKNFD